MRNLPISFSPPRGAGRAAGGRGQYAGVTFPWFWYQFLPYSQRSSRLNSLGCRRPIAERTVRPERVVLMSPALDQDLGLEQRIEEPAIEKLGAEFPVGRFDIAILPRASGLDEQVAHADLTQPLSDPGGPSSESRLGLRSPRSRKPLRSAGFAQVPGSHGPPVPDHAPGRIGEISGFLGVGPSSGNECSAKWNLGLG